MEIKYIDKQIETTFGFRVKTGWEAKHQGEALYMTDLHLFFPEYPTQKPSWRQPLDHMALIWSNATAPKVFWRYNNLKHMVSSLQESPVNPIR